jgi:NADH-quinone oxidoreductase subunit L
MGMPKVFGAKNLFEGFLAPVFAFSGEQVKGGHGIAQHGHALELGLMGSSIAIAAMGIFIAFIMYVRDRSLPGRFTAAFPLLYRAVFNKWYVDEMYDLLIVNPCKATARMLWKGFDVVVVDGVVNGAAALVMGASRVIKNVQSGFVHGYALFMAVGVAVMVVFYVFR